MRIETPWGLAQSVEQTSVPGIEFVSTESHGGYRLNARMTMRMREAMPSAFGACTGAGIPMDDGGSWWEEDCAWAYVCLAFPAAFPADALVHAEKTIEWLAGGRSAGSVQV